MLDIQRQPFKIFNSLVLYMINKGFNKVEIIWDEFDREETELNSSTDVPALVMDLIASDYISTRWYTKQHNTTGANVGMWVGLMPYEGDAFDVIMDHTDKDWFNTLIDYWQVTNA